MQNIKAIIIAKLGLKGITCKVQSFPGEGIKITVTRLADTFGAEEVAREIESKFGIETLVAF